MINISLDLKYEIKKTYTYMYIHMYVNIGSYQMSIVNYKCR